MAEIKTEKQKLIEHIKRLARSYTPEWKFDEEQPDIAAALALIYSDMFYGTIRRFKGLGEKNQTAFFDTIGTKLHPSVPAQGYVVFGMSSQELGGVEVPKGFEVMSAAGEEQKEISFETQENVYVTPSCLEEIILTDGTEDSIQKVSIPFVLFQSDNTNQQEHWFVLGQNEILNLTGPTSITLWLKLGSMEQKGLLEKLTQQAVFEYFSENGFIRFGEVFLQSDCVILELKEGQPPFAKMEWQGQENYTIRCRLQKPWKELDFSIQDLKLKCQGQDLKPDTIQTENKEEDFVNVFAFGERPMPYREIYIASEQALSKAGSKVTVSFRMDYERIPMESQGELNRDWKLVMKREDFIPDPEYDVTIEEVSLEYFNGVGWSKLPTLQDYSHMFNGGDGSMGQKFTVEFLCPDDVAPFLYNSVESRYLRIRILKMNNLFKQRGNYITPIMSDIVFSFEYRGQGKSPDFLEAFNNRELVQFPVKDLQHRKVNWNLIHGIRDSFKTLYFRFSHPLDQGPIRLLFITEESIQKELPRLKFEYYAVNGFQELSLMDGTERMRKSGVLSFMGKSDFQKATIWGKEGFWLRVTDIDHKYQRVQVHKKIPIINGMFLNAVRVRAVKAMPEELFSIEPGEKNKICILLNQQIQNLEVWVDESRNLSRVQQNKLRTEQSVREEYNAQGMLWHFWVKWTETEDFYDSGPDDRHYIADRNQGKVFFSDGTAGAIPAAGEGQTIQIRYSCGGGEAGNQKEGQISQLSKTLGYINQVSNPCITSGGSNQETGMEAMIRSARRLRHGGRAVTTRDYEDLALEASSSILKVKCFPGCKEDGSREPGNVTIVVLQKHFKDGRLYFERVKQEILEYIGPRIAGSQNISHRFYVAEPQYLEFRCQIQIVIKSFDDAFEVKEQVLQQVKVFLDPIHGNFDKKGWEIGRIPNEIQITNAIKGIEGIQYIREVRMTAFMQSRQGWVEADLDNLDAWRFAVPLSGKHKVLIAVGH